MSKLSRSSPNRSMAETLVGKTMKLLESENLLIGNSVLTGLSRISNVNKDSIWEKVPLFSPVCEVDQGSLRGLFSDIESDTTSDKTSDETSDEGSEDSDVEFFEESILQHLNCEQLSMRQSLRRRIVKFQFSWYQLTPSAKSEKRLYPRKYSGRLYRDKHQRSLQLESFMVSDLLIRVWLEIEYRLGNCSLATYT